MFAPLCRCQQGRVFHEPRGGRRGVRVHGLSQGTSTEPFAVLPYFMRWPFQPLGTVLFAAPDLVAVAMRCDSKVGRPVHRQAQRCPVA